MYTKTAGCQASNENDASEPHSKAANPINTRRPSLSTEEERRAACAQQRMESSLNSSQQRVQDRAICHWITCSEIGCASSIDIERKRRCAPKHRAGTVALNGVAAAQRPQHAFAGFHTSLRYVTCTGTSLSRARLRCFLRWTVDGFVILRRFVVLVL